MFRSQEPIPPYQGGGWKTAGAREEAVRNMVQQCQEIKNVGDRLLEKSKQPGANLEEVLKGWMDWLHDMGEECYEEGDMPPNEKSYKFALEICLHLRDTLHITQIPMLCPGKSFGAGSAALVWPKEKEREEYQLELFDGKCDQVKGRHVLLSGKGVIESWTIPMDISLEEFCETLAGYLKS